MWFAPHFARDSVEPERPPPETDSPGFQDALAFALEKSACVGKRKNFGRENLGQRPFPDLVGCVGKRESFVGNQRPDPTDNFDPLRNWRAGPLLLRETRGRDR